MSLIPHRQDTPQHTCSKRKQHFEDGGASKLAHIELASVIEGGSSSIGYPARWTYEEFALRYHMLVPALLRKSEIRDMVKRIMYCLAKNTYDVKCLPVSDRTVFRK
jgi:hypothetical protein